MARVLSCFLFFNLFIYPFTRKQQKQKKRQTTMVTQLFSKNGASKNAREMAEILAALDRSQAVIEFNLDGIILTANQNFLDAMGYSLDEIQGQHHSMFAEPEYAKSQEYKDFWKILGRGEFQAAQYKRLAKGGREIWIEASYNPILDKNGKPYKVVKYATDITQKSLEHAEQTSMVDAISRSQAVIEFELDGTILNANENFLSVMGYDLSEIKGQHHSMFAEPDFAASAEYKEFWEKLRKGEFQAGQYKRLAKGGREIWIEASYNPILDMNGKPFKVVKFATDLTPRKEANQKLANDFETNVQALVQNVVSASGDMEATTGGLARSAEETSGQANMVAAAAEQLSASVNEISDQVSNSVRIANEAMSEVKRSEELVSELVEAAGKIGEVTALISDIADQTNLLALNATIEAARAGEAGKGFAVVASEVKTLAASTAKATEEIAGQIAAIQNVSETTAKAMHEVAEVMKQVNDISGTISAAVDQQSQATREVSSNIIGVQSAAGETGDASNRMVQVTGEMSGTASDLQGRVDAFLNNVRKM